MPSTPNDPWLPVGYTNSVAAPLIVVYRYDPDAGEPLEIIDSVEFLDVMTQEGPHPKVARFRYRLGMPNTPGNPTTLEECLSDTYDLPGVVKPGDRIVVAAFYPDGVVGPEFPYEFWFDGVAHAFEGDWGDGSEEVLVICRGIECRLWDNPVGGMLMRDAAQLDTDGDDTNVQTSLPVIFNPRGLPNCIPNGTEVGLDKESPEAAYPIFMDVLAIGPPDRRTLWRLEDAVKYLLATGNKDEAYVKNPKFPDLDDLLFAREPVGGGNGTIDPTDPSTFEEKPIYVSNIPATGKDICSVIHHMIGDKGFALRFDLAVGADGLPETSLVLYRAQDGPEKALRLQERCANLDIDLSNLGEMGITRDITDAPNAWIVDGGLWRYQVGVILQCGYASAGAADAGVGGQPSTSPYNSNRFLTDAGKAYINDYRLYVADETGDGHYEIGDTAKVAGAFDWTQVFGTPGDKGVPKYIVRRRPPYGELVDKDALGKPLPHKLEWSTDYTGLAPALWVPGFDSAVWHLVQPGTYRLLKDRLGIYITVDDPESWTVGRKVGSSAAHVLRGVKSQADPDAQNPKFWLRLTCVVEGDNPLQGIAERRDTAALPYNVVRRVDARDRYLGTVIHNSCPVFDASQTPAALGTGTRSDIVIVRDDTEKATAEAMSLRDATDSGVMDGPVTIGRLTTEYRVGDRISEVDGRTLGFRTDTGGAPPEFSGDGGIVSPKVVAVLPVVVSVHLDILGQTTTLQLSDSNRGRESYRRRGMEKGNRAYAEKRRGR